MGKCISTKESSIDLSRPTKDNAKPNTNQPSKSLSLNDQQLPEKFKDMPEIDDKYVGQGVRRMKAYKCDLVIDELQKLQEQFWSNNMICKLADKMNVNKVLWKHLKQICLVDEGIFYL